MLIKYVPALSEVVYQPLEVAVGTLKKAHIMLYVLKKIKIKIKQCHKLLLLLGVDFAHS